MNTHFKELDVVALLKNIPEEKLIIGQVGTIVLVHNDNTFEVEFCDMKGKTISLLTLEKKDLMLLHYEAEYA
ncbi:MAG: DUF4926 domain-containing protein [Bacteroidetes bacterium]|nr:DUF4926 domain-containing protein [Bacteroidota bacterium]